MRIGEGQAVRLPLCRGGGHRDRRPVRLGMLRDRQGGRASSYGEGARADHEVRRRHHGRHVEAHAREGVRVHSAVGKECRVGGEGGGGHQHVGHSQRGHRARGERHTSRRQGHAARRVARGEEEVEA